MSIDFSTHTLPTRLAFVNLTLEGIFNRYWSPYSYEVKRLVEWMWESVSEGDLSSDWTGKKNWYEPSTVLNMNVKFATTDEDSLFYMEEDGFIELKRAYKKVPHPLQGIIEKGLPILKFGGKSEVALADFVTECQQVAVPLPDLEAIAASNSFKREDLLPHLPDASHLPDPTAENGASSLEALFTTTRLYKHPDIFAWISSGSPENIRKAVQTAKERQLDPEEVFENLLYLSRNYQVDEYGNFYQEDGAEWDELPYEDNLTLAFTRKSLSLEHQSLEEFIPEIGLLTHLEELNLSQNHFAIN